MKTTLHIGFPKTGTTWLQTCYFPLLENTCFLGPKDFYPLHNGNECRLIIHEKETPESKFNSLVISNPELTGLIGFKWDHGKAMQDIAHQLKTLYPEAEILIMLRNQASFIASGYVYYIRKGGTLKVQQYFNRVRDDESSFSFDYLKYSEIIELYCSLFGKDKVHVLLYENFIADKPMFVRQLSDKFGFGTNSKTVNYLPKNRRLRKNLMKIMRFTNRFSKTGVLEKKAVFHIPFLYGMINDHSEYFNHYRIFGEPMTAGELLNPNIRNFLNDYFREDNRLLIDKFGITDIKKFKYPGICAE